METELKRFQNMFRDGMISCRCNSLADEHHLHHAHCNYRLYCENCETVASETRTHEAAHWVIGHALGIFMGKIALYPDSTNMGSTFYETWDRSISNNDKPKKRTMHIHAEIMMLMAGEESLVLFCDQLLYNYVIDARGDGDTIERLLDVLYTRCEKDKWRVRLKRHTAILVRRHKNAITLVSNALAEMTDARTMSRKDILRSLQSGSASGTVLITVLER